MTPFLAMFFFDGMGGIPGTGIARTRPQAPGWDYLKKLGAWRAARFLMDKREIVEELKKVKKDVVDDSARVRARVKQEAEDINKFLAALERASNQELYISRNERIARKIELLCEEIEAQWAKDEAEDEEEAIKAILNG